MIGEIKVIIVSFILALLVALLVYLVYYKDENDSAESESNNASYEVLHKTGLSKNMRTSRSDWVEIRLIKDCEYVFWVYGGDPKMAHYEGCSNKSHRNE